MNPSGEEKEGAHCSSFTKFVFMSTPASKSSIDEDEATEINLRSSSSTLVGGVQPHRQAGKITSGTNSGTSTSTSTTHTSSSSPEEDDVGISLRGGGYFSMRSSRSNSQDIKHGISVLIPTTEAPSPSLPRTGVLLPAVSKCIGAGEEGSLASKPLPFTGALLSSPSMGHSKRSSWAGGSALKPVSHSPPTDLLHRLTSLLSTSSYHPLSVTRLSIFRSRMDAKSSLPAAGAVRRLPLRRETEPALMQQPWSGGGQRGSDESPQDEEGASSVAARRLSPKKSWSDSLIRRAAGAGLMKEEEEEEGVDEAVPVAVAGVAAAGKAVPSADMMAAAEGSGGAARRSGRAAPRPALMLPELSRPSSNILQRLTNLMSDTTAGLPPHLCNSHMDVKPGFRAGVVRHSMPGGRHDTVPALMPRRSSDCCRAPDPNCRVPDPSSIYLGSLSSLSSLRHMEASAAAGTAAAAALLMRRKPPPKKSWSAAALLQRPSFRPSAAGNDMLEEESEEEHAGQGSPAGVVTAALVGPTTPQNNIHFPRIGS